MSSFSRDDVYMRGEPGASWFNEFLNEFAKEKAKSCTTVDLVNAIYDRKPDSVNNIIKKYRDAVGLDLLTESDKKHLGLKVSASGLGPIAPMKLKKVTSPEEILDKYEKSDIIIQYKIDGFKTQGIIYEDNARLFTRRGDDFTSNVPQLAEDLKKLFPKNSFVLGELAWIDNSGKQSISDIQTVVSSSPEKAREKLESGSGRAVFYVYDLLWESGKDITKESYEIRYNKLQKLIEKGTKNIELVKNYSFDEYSKAIDEALKAGGEGIVLKPKKAEYKYAKLGENEPIGEQAKFKPGAKSKEADVFVQDYTIGAGGKLIMPAYQYKDREIIEVGKVSGLPKEEEKEVKQLLDAGKKVVIEVGYQEKMESGKFRHMSYKRIRKDKPAKEVKMSTYKPLSIRQAFREIEILYDPEAYKAAVCYLNEHFPEDLAELYFNYTIDDLIKVLFKFLGERGIKLDRTNNKHILSLKLALEHYAKDNKIKTKIASTNPQVLKDHPEIAKIVDSFCQHSGGTKSTMSIVNYLREKLGKDIVNYTDEELKKYIEERKQNFKNTNQEAIDHDVGRVGLDRDFNDMYADYAIREKGK